MQHYEVGRPTKTASLSASPKTSRFWGFSTTFLERTDDVMRFTLFYRGELKSNGGAVEKQAIRRVFNPQLRCLWSQPPLADFSAWLAEKPEAGNITLVERFGKFQFVPLVSERIHMVAEIGITMLRPGPPGDLVSHAGDLDNRIKTLLDALRVPKESTAVRKDDEPRDGETPFFCLLGDDRLVTHLSIKTESLLDSSASHSEVVMLLHVTTRPTRLTFANVGLGA